MIVWSDTINAEFISDSLNVPAEIISFTIMNTSALTITANVYIKDINGNDVAIVPKDLSLGVNTGLVNDTLFYIPKGYKVRITTTDDLSFYFTIKLINESTNCTK